jgi:uncharacterized metal-binding protein YceD (DUF177 family)
MSRPAQPLLPEAVVRIEPMPPGGRQIVVTADAEARAGVAGRLKITTLESLEARLKAVRLRGGIRVTGQVRARTVQPCVVTFEPVTQDIDEPVDRIFLPASQRPREPEPGSEAFVDLEGDDPPDYFEGIDLDLTELIVETVALALDPYPRAPGAEIEAGDEPKDEEDGPFAALRRLKDEGERG